MNIRVRTSVYLKKKVCLLTRPFTTNSQWTLYTKTFGKKTKKKAE